MDRRAQSRAAVRRLLVRLATLSCLLSACASKHPMDPVIASRPVVEGASQHDHVCMAAAEQKWATRLRELPSKANEPLLASPSPKQGGEAHPQLPDDIATGEYGADSDLFLTLKIRTAVMAEPSLSFEAKNVKILTLDGRVTVRGKVKSAKERETLERIAGDIAGRANVNVKP